MKLMKECNRCENAHCNHKIKSSSCSQYKSPKVLTAPMVEIAAYRELIQYGAIMNVSRALVLKGG